MADEADPKRPAFSDSLLNSDILAQMLGSDAMQILRCGICMEFFDNPVVLPCGHTFCLQCLTEMCRHAAASSSTPLQVRSLRVGCPNCRVLIYASPILEKNVTCNFIVQSLLDCLRARSRSAASTQRMPTETPRRAGNITPLSDLDISHVTQEVDRLLTALEHRSVLDHACWEVEEIRSQHIAESIKLKKALSGQRDPKQSMPEPPKQPAPQQKEPTPFISSYKKFAAPTTAAAQPDVKCQLNLHIAPPGNTCKMNLLPAPPGFKQAPIFVPQGLLAKHTSSNINHTLNDINKYTATKAVGGAVGNPSNKVNNPFGNWSFPSSQQNNESFIRPFNHDNKGLVKTSRTVEVLPMKRNVDIPCNTSGKLSFNDFDQRRNFSRSQTPVISTTAAAGKTAMSGQSVFGKYTKGGFLPGKTNHQQMGFASIIDKPEANKTQWNIGGFGSMMGEGLGYNGGVGAKDMFKDGLGLANRTNVERVGEMLGAKGGSKMATVLQSQRPCAERLNNDPAIMSVVTSMGGIDVKPSF